jgi:hypothetical protein
MFIVCIILNKVANAFSNKHTLISPSYPFWIPGFPDSRIPRFPDSPFPVLKIAQLLLVRPADV